MLSTIHRFLQSLNQEKPVLAVAGDSLVDEYYYMTSERLSPEFPIPVMLSRENDATITMPGGAGNVAIQLREFGVNPTLYGFVNQKSKPIYNSIKSVTENVVSIPTKKRFYSGDFPLCRWDVEDASYGMSIDDLDVLQTNLLAAHKLQNPDVTILSDYNKGFFFNWEIKQKWIKQSKASIVDPKLAPAWHWDGCTVFKPNAKEAKNLSGAVYWKDQCKILQEDTNCKFCVVTHAEDAVVGYSEAGDYFKYTPKHPAKAVSVIGAGDTFVAFLALAYAYKMPIEECIEVAFETASAYVCKKHNEPITKYDLLRRVDPISAKFVASQDLVDKSNRLIFANGCFDFLGSHHIDLLQWAKSQGDKLVVAVNSDASVARLKGNNRPVNKLQDRMKTLAALECVDYVVSFDEDTPLELIKKIQPAVIVKGGDYQKEDVVGYNIVKETLIFPFIEGKSTTKTINRMQNATTQS